MSKNRPILLDIPEKFETERLFLRIPNSGDSNNFNYCTQETFKQLNIWMPWAKEMPTIEDTKEFIINKKSEFLKRESLTYFIINKNNNRVIGIISLQNIDWDIPIFDIGYWLTISSQGHGFMTEAVNSIVKFAFIKLNAKRITIRLNEGNQKSMKVAERCGFQLEGLLRNSELMNNGSITGVKIYSLISNDSPENN